MVLGVSEQGLVRSGDGENLRVGIHRRGSLMMSTLELGAMDEQNDAVSDKFIYSTRSVAALKNGEFRIVYGKTLISK